MGSVDVNSLFTNIRLEENIDNCINTLFENTEKVEGLSKLESKELLLQKNPILYLTESSTSKPMEPLWVHPCSLWVPLSSVLLF